MQEVWAAVLIPGSGRSPGGGNGNPLQYSCLENPMDRGTWQVIVHRAAKSWTWSDLTHTVFHHINMYVAHLLSKAPRDYCHASCAQVPEGSCAEDHGCLPKCLLCHGEMNHILSAYFWSSVCKPVADALHPTWHETNKMQSKFLTDFRNPWKLIRSIQL